MRRKIWFWLMIACVAWNLNMAVLSLRRGVLGLALFALFAAAFCGFAAYMNRPEE